MKRKEGKEEKEVEEEKIRKEEEEKNKTEQNYEARVPMPQVACILGRGEGNPGGRGGRGACWVIGQLVPAERWWWWGGGRRSKGSRRFGRLQVHIGRRVRGPARTGPARHRGGSSSSTPRGDINCV